MLAKSTYFIVLLTMFFIWWQEQLFAQDSFKFPLKTLRINGELKIDSPKEGTYYNEVDIVWYSESLNKFSLYYDINNNSNWEIIEEEYTDSSEYWKHYTWQFQNLNAENVKIKVASFYDTNIFDVSPDITLKYRIAIGDSTYDSLDTFYPLEVGNVWQYKVTNTVDDNDNIVNKGYDFMKVLSDTIIGDNRYFKVETVIWDEVKYLRYDSLESSIVRYLGNEEAISFKLNSLKNDCWDFEFMGKEICNKGTYLESIFGIEKPVIYFSQVGFNSRYYNLAKDFGPTWIMNDQSWTNIDFWHYDLVYAKINGVEYGTFVSVENEDTNYPKDYSLSQNYPNPFNPTTIINYSIPEQGKVALKVFDILGREIKTLVNKYQAAGSYEVEFNATELSSGIYFYRIIADGFVETKKMILMR